MQTQTQACHAIDSEFVSIYQHPSTTGKLRKKQLIIAATVAALCRTPKQSTHNYITKKNTHVAARLCGAPIYYSALPCHALLSRTCVLFPAIRALRFSRVHRHHHSRSPPVPVHHRRPPPSACFPSRLIRGPIQLLNLDPPPLHQRAPPFISPAAAHHIYPCHLSAAPYPSTSNNQGYYSNRPPTHPPPRVQSN